MYLLQIDHRVPDYRAWKNAFDSDPSVRQQMGVQHYQVLRLDGDPDFVTVQLYFNSLEQTRKAFTILLELWAKPDGKVMINPKARIMEITDSATL